MTLTRTVADSALSSGRYPMKITMSTGEGRIKWPGYPQAALRRTPNTVGCENPTTKRHFVVVGLCSCHTRLQHDAITTSASRRPA
jgi:hypothetical protein